MEPSAHKQIHKFLQPKVKLCSKRLIKAAAVKGNSCRLQMATRNLLV